jgi:hypothetical protein
MYFCGGVSGGGFSFARAALLVLGGAVRRISSGTTNTLLFGVV